MSNYEILGDSAEYELITEAIELSKGIDGMCVEIGLRLGMGTKMIIDAVRQYCPNKMVISIDPYGSILYHGREHMEPCRLDYTNDMKIKCLSNIYQYLEQNPVNYQFFNWTDHRFFDYMAYGVPIYEQDEIVLTRYSFVHLDGPHNVKHVVNEILWFNERMDAGATIVIDDITPDFIRIEPVNDAFIQLGWKWVKRGEKKGIWQKC